MNKQTNIDKSVDLNNNDDSLGSLAQEAQKSKSSLAQEANRTERQRKIKKDEPVDRYDRPERIPLDEQSTIGIAQEAGYAYRLVNDIGNRIERFKQAGWEIVDGSSETEHRRVQKPSKIGYAASQSVGGGLEGYYMRIPIEWWKESQIKKREKLNKKMNSTILKNIKSRDFYSEVSIDTKINK